MVLELQTAAPMQIPPDRCVRFDDESPEWSEWEYGVRYACGHALICYASPITWEKLIKPLAGRLCPTCQARR